MLVIAGKSSLNKEKLLGLAAEIAEAGTSLRILNASKIFGIDHIKSAFEKAVRAFEQKNNVSDSIITETMLYMSGCRQIQEAFAFYSIKENVTSIVALIDADPASSADLICRLKIDENDSIISVSSSKDIIAFGISSKELSTIDKKKENELILERVASVDIKKK